jgi:YidC/Oxa1 family membrane protein insertase
VETNHYVALFTTKGARLKSLILKSYRTDLDPKSPPFDLISQAPGLPLPLGVEWEAPETRDDGELVYAVEGSDLRLKGDAKGTLLFRAQTPGGMTIAKEFTFEGSSFPIQMALSVEGPETKIPAGIKLVSLGENKGSKKDAVFEGLVALLDNRIKREPLAEITKGQEWKGSVSWAGFGYTYFLFALVPEGGGAQRVTVRKEGPGVAIKLQGESGVSPGEKIRYTLFAGPKDLDLLKSAGHGLERSINFGYFAFVSLPLLYVLRFFHRFTVSYGTDIILLTVLIKLLLAPLTHKSFVSMKQMQKLQPQMERIKEKFKNDREGLNKEIMELYRRNKVNPFGGCLPMVLQIPVFIGLYNALLTPIELRHAPFLWIQDLSRPDWESLPLKIGDWNMGIPVLTVLMGASMFVQQWMTPSAGDPNQRRMMLLMPLVFTVMFVTFPAGLTIYWLVNNVLSIGQQYIINRLNR